MDLSIKISKYTVNSKSSTSKHDRIPAIKRVHKVLENKRPDTNALENKAGVAQVKSRWRNAQNIGIGIELSTTLADISVVRYPKLPNKLPKIHGRVSFSPESRGKAFCEQTISRLNDMTIAENDFKLHNQDSSKIQQAPNTSKYVFRDSSTNEDLPIQISLNSEQFQLRMNGRLRKQLELITSPYLKSNNKILLVLNDHLKATVNVPFEIACQSSTITHIHKTSGKSQYLYTVKCACHLKFNQKPLIYIFRNVH